MTSPESHITTQMELLRGWINTINNSVEELEKVLQPVIFFNEPAKEAVKDNNPIVQVVGCALAQEINEETCFLIKIHERIIKINNGLDT